MADRCIAVGLAKALPQFGFKVLTLGDVYGNDGKHVEDTTWIRDAAQNGYVVFTANPAIFSVAHEKAAVMEHGAKIFCIANPNQTRDGRGLIFGRHLLQIVRRSRREGACFWRLDPGQSVKYDIP